MSWFRKSLPALEKSAVEAATVALDTAVAKRKSALARFVNLLDNLPIEDGLNGLADDLGNVKKDAK